jgi:hypothetical protein
MCFKNNDTGRPPYKLVHEQIVHKCVPIQHSLMSFVDDQYHVFGNICALFKFSECRLWAQKSRNYGRSNPSLLIRLLVPGNNLGFSHSQHGYSVAIKRIECTNSSIVTVYACKLKLLRGKIGEFSSGILILQSVPIVLVSIMTINSIFWHIVFFLQKFRVSVERKNSANYYVPTIMDVTFNLCELTKNRMAMTTLDNLLTTFVPEAMEIIKPFLHRCPYIVSMSCVL